MQPALTAAQRVFAAGLASGQSQTKAYRAAHPGIKARPETVASKAAAAAQNVAVQAEVIRLLSDPAVLDRCPAWANLDALAEHAVATMVRLIKSGVDDPGLAVKIKACQWLIEYTDHRRREAAPAAPKVLPQPEPPPDPRAAILADLRGLYAKALQPPPLELTAEAEEAAVVTADNPAAE